MRRVIFPILMGIVGTVVLVSLGVWQLQRMAWKESVLAEIDGRIGDAPVAVPAAPDPGLDRFLPVTAAGTITDDEVHVLVSLRGVGPGYRVISVFETDDGRRLMLDRGFIGAEEKDAERPEVRATISGNLHWPDEVDRFTPEPDDTDNIWFARDVPLMSVELGTEPLLIILRDSSETDPPVMPLPVDSGGIPNDHLEYAITWFGLAAVWVAMSIFLLRRIAQRKE